MTDLFDAFPPAPFRVAAVSDAVTGDKPYAAVVGDQLVVLWRDAAGQVRALEDRCPHRRAPLSLGCIRDGDIQCGYHGWKLGGDGLVKRIPQLREERKLPAIYSATAFAVHETGGMVFVDISGTADRSAPAPPAQTVLPLHGRTTCLLDSARIIEVLLDGPHLLLDIAGVHLSEYPLADPECSANGMVRYSRAGRKAGGWWPDRLRGELPLALHVVIDPARGLVSLSLRDRDEREALAVLLALTPTRRGTTTIHWRAQGASKDAFAFRSAPDAAALEVLLKDVSHRIPGAASVAAVASAA